MRRNPLAFIEELSRDSTAGVMRLPWGAMRLPWGGWCARDGEPAQTLLRDPDCHAGGSVFFGELLPDRAAQVELGRAVRGLLRAGVPHYRAAVRGGGGCAGVRPVAGHRHAARVPLPGGPAAAPRHAGRQP
ncbi:hypothetical protein [Streptomyces diacarni]|uniref:hypothetical protein n=1 Tax=Streptomyces diacarni TaxID=2800381 RepID=UPI001FEA1096|nr:hypothetical protein [Streptomyces diacarni]